jgi:hypothetical protein
MGTAIINAWNELGSAPKCSRYFEPKNKKVRKQKMNISYFLTFVSGSRIYYDFLIHFTG